MLVVINGEKREMREGLSLLELVEYLNFKAEQIAIELNRVVVRKSDWAATKLKEGDQLEIVHFVGGGAPGDSTLHKCWNWVVS